MKQRRECVILVGIQGAGKSTFYSRQFSDTHIRINLDMLRTRPREKSLFEACINATQHCVIDNTNTTIEERRKYIESAKKSGYVVSCYCFEPKIKECLKRNEKREGKNRVATTAIISRCNKFQPPSKEEGFDEIHRVSIVNGEFEVENNSTPKNNKAKIKTRKLSVPISEKIDWRTIIHSLAWDMNLAVEIKEPSDSVSKSLALLELIGEERLIVEFSNRVSEVISKAIENVPSIEIVRGFYTISKWRSPKQEPKKMAVNLGLRLDVLSVDERWFEKTVFYELEGRSEIVKEFVEKTSHPDS
jgi:predicted kinase